MIKRSIICLFFIIIILITVGCKQNRYDIIFKHLKETKPSGELSPEYLEKEAFVRERFRIYDGYSIYYKDTFSGCWEQDGDIIVGLNKSPNYREDAKFLKENNIKYVYQKYSYNFLNLICCESDNFLDSKGYENMCEVFDQDNCVYINIEDESYEDELIIHLKDKGMYIKDTLFFFIYEITSVFNSRDINGCEWAYKYITDSSAFGTTICSSAVKNSTGELGVITAGHLGGINTEVYYSESVNGQLDYGTHLGLITDSLVGNNIDGSFITFEDQGEWITTPYVKYNNNVYTNIYLGNNSQIVVGNNVVMIGQSSGYCTGQIKKTNESITIYNTTISNVFSIDIVGTDGDSGSPVFYVSGNNLYLIGLYFGESINQILPSSSKGYICRISNIMNQFGVTPITNDSFNTTDLANGTIRLDGINFNISGEYNIPSSIKGKTVTQIGSNAFYNKTSLTNVVIPNTITSIGSNAFKNCTNLTDITLSNTLASIGSSAFEGCSSLVSIALPNTLTSIGSNAFKGCGSLEEITIPYLITSIEYETFKNCTSLETITINRAQKNLITLGTNAFQGCTSLNEIIVPRDRIADYKNSWSSYRSIIIPNNNSFPYYDIDEDSNINIIPFNIDPGYNILYKLNVIDKAAYVISVTSGTNPLITLYNSSFTLIDSSSSSINEILLNNHTYYLSIEHSNTNSSGSIYVNIQKDPNHVHIYDNYIWYNYTKHKKECDCGVSGGYQPHAVEQGSFQPGQQYATCILCGGQASIGLVGLNGNNLYPTSLNGSYILPNGVIVLASADIDSYLDGTLVFIDPNTELLNNYNNYPYLLKREDNYFE